MNPLLLLPFILFQIPSTTYYESPKPAYTEVVGIVTAYSEIDSCHYVGCPMASGKKAYIGAVACSRDIPLGTKIVIGKKEYVCEDRYHKDLSWRIDVFMGYGEESYEKAKEWGRQELLVRILR